jgi:predicted nucleic acid-binding protein
MKIVVPDSNIIFRALRSPNSSTRTTLMREDCHFYTPNFLFAEIFKYKEKILLRSKASEEEVYEYLVLLLQKIRFIPEDWVSLGCRIEAFRLYHDTDEKDTPFLALALEMEAKLWTSDEVLKSGLMKKGFHDFFNDSQD